MSVILDALKKLDRERSSRRSGTANIAVEMLRPDFPRPGKRAPLYATLAFLIVVAAVAITYTVMGKRGTPPKSSPPLAMNSPSPLQSAESVPLPRESVREPQDELGPVSPKPQTSVKSKRSPAPLPENRAGEKKTNQSVVLKEADIAPPKPKIPVEPSPSGFASTSPSVNISAIVWYEEPSRRFAMINGVIATEGSVIEGMKVEEIFPNRVRFFHNSQHFEIFIK
jgi:general secretion pathway protein B